MSGLGSLVCRGECTPSPALLLIPGVGPFVLASQTKDAAHDGGNAKTLWLVDGALQTGGLVLAVAGLILDSKTSLVPDVVQAGGARIRVQPALAAGSAGVMLGGTF